MVILSQPSGVKLDKPVIDKTTTQAVFAALLISTLGPDCRCNYVDIGIYHCNSFHDDVIKWKHYRALLVICAGNHRSPVNSPQKVQWRGALMFPLIPHQMETFSALLALCAGNSPVTGESPFQKPVMQSFDVFFDLSLNKQLSKQSWGWWF